jgi:hypothetical protein
MLSRVPFVTIGGTAVACYLPPRRPADLDIVLSVSPRSVDRAVRALRTTVERCGLITDGPGVALDKDALQRGNELVISLQCGQLHIVGNNLPEQVDPEAVIARRQWWFVDRSLIPIAMRDDLVAIKIANGSQKDLADSRALCEQ